MRRQEMLLGKKNSAIVAKSKVTIVGVGALGCVCADLLARTGVGWLTLIDRDIVEKDNLHRQTLYTKKDIGEPKVLAAKQRLEQVSETEITAHIADLNPSTMDLIGETDLILDCTDNLAARYLLNDYCRKTGTPWVYAGVVEQKGFVMPITKDTPCFRCVMGEKQSPDTCATAGVMPTAVTSIGSLQAGAAVEILIDKFKAQRLVHFDTKRMALSVLSTKKRADCPTCNGNYEYLEGKHEPTILAAQCEGIYAVHRDIDVRTLASKLEGKGDEHAFFYRNISLFPHKAIVRADTLDKAKADLDKVLG